MKPTTPVALTNSDIEPKTSLRFQSNRKKEDMDKRRLKMRQLERKLPKARKQWKTTCRQDNRRPPVLKAPMQRSNKKKVKFTFNLLIFNQ